MDGEERKKMLAQLLEQTDINNSKAILTVIKCLGNTKGRGNGEANSDGGDWGSRHGGSWFSNRPQGVD